MRSKNAGETKLPDLTATRRRFLTTCAGGAIAAGGFAGCAPDIAGENDMELAVLDSVETVRRIRDGEITIVEVVSAAIERAERLNPRINAIVNETFGAAREAATSGRSGVLAGLPFFVKDLTDVVGQPTEYGSRAFAGNVARSQSAFVDAVESLGVVSLGKSATPEFGLTATTEPLAHGPTRNPWNLDHSTGGSSGGAGALVAAGVVPMAHASDGGGSIRIPAACCGLVGLKASRGRLPSAFTSPDPPIVLSTSGVLTRNVADTAAFFKGVEANVGSGGAPAIGDVAGPGAARLKIGLFTDGPAGLPVHADVIAAVENAGMVCAELGHDVETIANPFDAGPGEDFLLYWASLARKAVMAWEQSVGRRAGYDDFEPLTFGLIQHFDRNRNTYDKALRRLTNFGSIYERAFGEFDILLSPVLSDPPPRIGYLRPDLNFDVMMARVTAYAQFTGGQNLAGAPAISLPLGQSTAGLPIGVMAAAKRGRDRRLLELGFELEEAAPWRDRRPPLFG